MCVAINIAQLVTTSRFKSNTQKKCTFNIIGKHKLSIFEIEFMIISEFIISLQIDDLV